MTHRTDIYEDDDVMVRMFHNSDFSGWVDIIVAEKRCSAKGEEHHLPGWIVRAIMEYDPEEGQ